MSFWKFSCILADAAVLVCKDNCKHEFELTPGIIFSRDYAREMTQGVTTWTSFAYIPSSSGSSWVKSEILTKDIQTSLVPGSGGGAAAGTGGKEVVHHCTRFGLHWTEDRDCFACYYFLSSNPTYAQISPDILCFSLNLNSVDGFQKLYKVVLSQSNGEVANNIQHCVLQHFLVQ